jgi:glutamine amidotransferase
MCRFVAYLGKEDILINDLLEKPNNSLIKQSRAAKEGGHGINADGLGMAWYNLKIDREPGIFKSIQPAWNDTNLVHISKKIESNCFLGHIRASTIGDVTHSNCHPFANNEYSFVHNGTIRHFDKIKRKLLEQLSEDLFLSIKGQTDSECLFHLILKYLYEDECALESAVRKAFDWICEAQSQYDDTHFSRLNIVITNGKEMVSTRFVSKSHDPISLHYCIKPSQTLGIKDSNRAIIIASEPLDSNLECWEEVPYNHSLAISSDRLGIRIKKLLM